MEQLILFSATVACWCMMSVLTGLMFLIITDKQIKR